MSEQYKNCSESKKDLGSSKKEKRARNFLFGIFVYSQKREKFQQKLGFIFEELFCHSMSPALKDAPLLLENYMFEKLLSTIAKKSVIMKINSLQYTDTIHLGVL